MGSILERLAPADLPGQVQALVDALAQVQEDTHKLAELSAASTIRRRYPEPILIHLSNFNGAPVEAYRTSQALDVVGIVASGTTPTDYALQARGESIMTWRLTAAKATVVLPLGGQSHIVVDRGLPLSLFANAVDVTAEATLFCYARAEDQR